MDFGSFLRNKEHSKYLDDGTSSTTYTQRATDGPSMEYGTNEDSNYEMYGYASSYDNNAGNDNFSQGTDGCYTNYDNSYQGYDSSMGEPYSGNTSNYQDPSLSYDGAWNSSDISGSYTDDHDHFATSARGQPGNKKFGQQGKRGVNVSRGSSRGRDQGFNRGRGNDRGRARGRGNDENRGRGRGFRGRGQQQFERGAHRGGEYKRGGRTFRGEKGRGEGTRGRGFHQHPEQYGSYDYKENPQEEYEESGHMNSMETWDNQYPRDKETDGAMWGSSVKPDHVKLPAESENCEEKTNEKGKGDGEEDAEEDEDDEALDAIEKLPASHSRGLMSTLISIAGPQVLNRKPDPLPPPVPMKLKDESKIFLEKKKAIKESKELTESGVTPEMLEEANTDVNVEERDLLPDDIGKEAEKPEYFCRLCQVQTTSAKNLRDHLNGKGHKSTLEAFKQGKKPPNVTKTKKIFFKDASEMGQKSIAQDMVAKAEEPILGMSFITEYHSLSGIMCVCNLCAVKFDHNIVVSHVTGTKHRCIYMREKKPDVYIHIRKFGGKKSQLSAFLEELSYDVEKQDGRGEPVLKVYNGFNRFNKNKDSEDKEEATQSVDEIASTTEEKDDGTSENKPSAAVEEKKKGEDITFEDWVDQDVEKCKKLLEEKEASSPKEGFNDAEEDHSSVPNYGPGRSRPWSERGRGHSWRHSEMERHPYDDPFLPPRFPPHLPPEPFLPHLPPEPFPPHLPLEPFPPYPPSAYRRGLPYDPLYPPRPLSSRPYPYDDPYLDPLRRLPPRPDPYRDPLRPDPYRDPALRADPYSRRREPYLDPDPLKRFPPKTTQDPYLDPDPLKRVRKPEPYLDPDPLKRIPPKKQTAVSKPLVFDYGHHGGQKDKSKDSAGQWEDDIKNILGGAGKSRAPDSLALLSSTYSSPERSPSPKKSREDSKPARELPFSKPYIEMPEARKRLKDNVDYKDFKESSSSRKSQGFLKDRRNHARRESPPKRSGFQRTQTSGYSNYRKGRRSRSRSPVHPRNYTPRNRSPGLRKSYKSRSRSPDHRSAHRPRSGSRGHPRGRRSKSRSLSKSRSPPYSMNRRSSSRSPRGLRRNRLGSPQTRSVKRKLAPGKSVTCIEILDSPEKSRSPSPTISNRDQRFEDDATHHNKIVNDILAEADEEVQAEKIANMLLQMSSSLSDQEDAQGALKKLFSNPEITNALLAAKEKTSETQRAGTSSQRKLSDRDMQPKRSSRSPSDYYRKTRREQSPAPSSPPPSREKVAFSFSGFGRSSTLRNTLPSAFATDEAEDS